MPHLLEFDDGQVPDHVIKTRIPMKKWVTAHRWRGVMETSVGNLVLKKLSDADQEEVTLTNSIEEPQFFSWHYRIKELTVKGKTPEGLSGPETEELIELGRSIQPYMYRYIIRCFDLTRCDGPGSVEEFQILLAKLGFDEREELMNVILNVCMPSTDVSVDGGKLALAKEFQIPMPSDLTLENITADQMNALGAVAQEYQERWNAEIKKIQSSMQLPK